MKKTLQTLTLFMVIVFIVIGLSSCGTTTNQTQQNNNPTEVTVFHAGSLSVPFKKIAEEYQKEHPDIHIKLSSAGSKALAQKIITLHQNSQPLPDIYASADYSLITSLLFPKNLANFDILFAKNSIVIAYTSGSKYASEINPNNWYQILSREDVRIGRSDPELDPCGYRSVLVMELASKYYNQPDLYTKLKDHPGTVIKPKEVDLVADLETGNIDYFWIYESVARQHHFKYIKLPEQINLSSLKYADFYQTASIKLTKADGSTYIVRGKPIVYGITIPKGAPHTKAAEQFLQFILTRGLTILDENGQPPVNPAQYIGNKENLPENIKDLVIPASP